MIRKTLLLCAGVVTAAFLSLSACTSKVQASANYDLANQNQLAQVKLMKERQSVWETDLANDARFTLGLKLSNQEKKLAYKFAPTVVANLKRNEVYVHYLLTALKENNLPLELAAIPLVESGLNPNVRSHAGAHGPWQYMRSTGKSLGLEVNNNYDGIYDFVASTNASVKYLKRLHRDLGNWELVAAAYNQGEYGVKKAISSAKARGVKNISVDTVRISRGARGYVQRFKAFADVLKNPSQYGVRLPHISNRPSFKRIDVAGTNVKSLNQVAKISGAPLELLKKLNSGYKTDRIDAKHGLNMPIDHVESLEKALTNGNNSVAATKSLMIYKN